ncbi:MAG: single-stranded DNA-binding protein [Corynebacterium camporealensis]|uniref:single-stranded DNA-binding protein n=1 Tax=Corynebacterium camporealensis TaxID=161896 RepID=UPI002A92026D|nr:single-stranded DNA-binding protein [Corynebacterium camporealensis]MDY5839844.1 single-stranded DNA-binding protein [Corynebacterium camporealensis]
MSQLPITINGHVAKEPELTKYAGDKFKTRMRVASSRRYVERNDDKEKKNQSPDSADPQAAQQSSNGPIWRDTDNLFIEVEMWGQLAINVRRCVEKGMPVIVMGALNSYEWTDEQGKNRERVVIRAQFVGLDLNKFVIGAHKVERSMNPLKLPLPGDREDELTPDRDFSNAAEAAEKEAAEGESAQGASQSSAQDATKDSAKDTAADAQSAQQSSGSSQQRPSHPRPAQMTA